MDPEAAARYLSARRTHESAAERLAMERSAEAAAAYLEALREERAAWAGVLPASLPGLSPRSASRSPRA